MDNSFTKPPFTLPKAKQMLRWEMINRKYKGDMEIAVENFENPMAEAGDQPRR